MISLIVERTNKNISKILKRLSDKMESGKYTNLRETTIAEMEAFIGLLYYRGIYNVTNLSTKTLFSDKKGIHFFGATMSRDRFRFLLSYICFDDAITQPQRWKSNRFAAFWEVFEHFNDQCAKHLTRGNYMSINAASYYYLYYMLLSLYFFYTEIWCGAYNIC